MFTNITQLTQLIELADRSTIQASGTGKVLIELQHCTLYLSNCLFVKDLSYNLISLGSIMKPNYTILTHNKKRFELTDHKNNIILNGTFSFGKFEVTVEQNQSSTSLTNPSNILTLHQDAGHPSPKYLSKMYPALKITNLQFPTCNLCKITKSPFKRTLPTPQ
ncbi:hypothetical protein O181_099660 [Austropuccinia psidii MF-1]|uniref:Retrovirus-related Pol polyprotein from transposon TNT 1-94-like beta-barrel domain-containing protein n=1 Tax=Austropuccinia psidii MF-1 TaxID=1389203 RepID=A0A9Q3JE22_9BASI|nr:hypothetical protein [Austropuccinia psidii MF-1]